MKKTNTKDLVLKAIEKLQIRSQLVKKYYGVPVTYSSIAKEIKKDPKTAKYHVSRLIKEKVLIRDKKTGNIEFKD